MKTSDLRYGKQTDSLRKISLLLSRMETEHPPGTKCLWNLHSMFASFPSGRFIPSKQVETFRFHFGTRWLPHWRICSHISLTRTKIRGKHSLWALPETSLPETSLPFLQKLPGAKEAYYCNHLPEQEMQAPTLPPRLTEASPVHITGVSSNFNNVSNTHIFLEGW